MVISLGYLLLRLSLSLIKMSKLREPIIANSEKKFLLKALADWTRLDGRAFDEFRALEIKFGKDWGCCSVALGNTQILAQTSCEIQPPKSSRPSEGILNINIELSPMAAPHFEPGRQSELAVQLNRLLEKCVKDSKAVDLESLCIKTNEKVWSLKVDLNVLSHEGNILDCAAVALLVSLLHFRRPDVTSDGEEFIIHSHKQRDPIETVIHHYPITQSYAIFNAGEFIVADPNLLEEGVADACLTIGLNTYNELCGLHLGGKADLLPEVILQTVQKASKHAASVIERIKESVKNDVETRQQGNSVGFHMGNSNVDYKALHEELEMVLDQFAPPKKKKKNNSSKSKTDLSSDEIGKVESIGKGTAAFIPAAKGDSMSVMECSSDDES